MIDLAPLVNKSVPFRFKGADLLLDLSHALFSSYNIDLGTRLLFKAVGRDERLASARRILDEGSGVGVVGLAVAKAFPDAQVEASDRDLLARAFTERNRLRNKVKNLRVSPGLLAAGRVEAETGRPHGASFDYILSNIPAKAGGPVIAAFFVDAYRRLLPGGRVAVVIVKPLADDARTWLAAAGFSLVAEERGTMHAVFIGERPESVGGDPAANDPAASDPAANDPAANDPTASDPAVGSGALAGQGEAAPETTSPAVEAAGRDSPLPVAASAGPVITAEAPIARHAGVPGLLDLSALDLSAYVRREGQFSLGDERYRARGFWGLPDFDTIGFGPLLATGIAARAIAGMLIRDLLVVEPGVGHAALWAARHIVPERIDAASRDLLALAATGANLASLPGRKPAYRAIDALRLDELERATYDLIMDFPENLPEYDWIEAFWERSSRLLKKGGALVAVASSTSLTRMEKRKPSGFVSRFERKKRGMTGAVWRRE